MNKSYSIIVGLSLAFTAVAGNVQAAEENTEEKQPEPVYNTEVVNTQYTRSCKAIPQPEKEPERKVSGFSGERIYKRFENAIEHITNDRTQEAKEAFRALLESTKEKSYDRAIVSYNYGNMFMMEEDYDEALKHFINAVNTKELPIAQEISLAYNIGYIYYSQEQYKDAENWARQWFEMSAKTKPDTYVLLGGALVGQKRYKDAICAFTNAVEISTKKPSSSHFYQLLGAHWELKDVQGSAQINKQMVELFPEKEKLWTQLASMYNQLENTQDALAVQKLAYRQGILKKESQIKNLAGMYALEYVPYKSASIVEDQIGNGLVEKSEKNWKYVAGNYRLARERAKAAEAYGKAAELSDTGDSYVMQGNILLEMDKHNEAIEALSKGLEKGGLDGKKTGAAYLSRGIAKFNLKRYQEAIADMERASQYKKSRKPAKQWINYVKSKLES